MLPVLPLKAVLLPHMELKVQLKDERYQALVNQCYTENSKLVVAYCSDYANEAATLATIGCEAEVTSTKIMNNLVEITLTGIKSISFNEVIPRANVLYATGLRYNEDLCDLDDADPIIGKVFDSYQTYMSDLMSFDKKMCPDTCLTTLTSEDSFRLLTNISSNVMTKQQGLETLSVKKRFDFLLRCLHSEIDMLSFVSNKESAIRMADKVLN